MQRTVGVTITYGFIIIFIIVTCYKHKLKKKCIAGSLTLAIFDNEMGCEAGIIRNDVE